MSELQLPKKSIHKECQTIMITMCLADRVNNITYCPKCMTQKELNEVLKAT